MRRTIILLALFAAACCTAMSQPRQMNYSVQLVPVAPCGADLSVRHVTDDAAMGGHNTIEYAFKNNSSSPCTLDGYPRFELLDKSGRVRRGGRAVKTERLPGEETKRPPQLVTLDPGKEAWFSVYYNNGGAGYVGKPCPFSRKVRITAPGAVRRFVLRESIRSCRAVEVSSVRGSEPLQ